MTSDERERSAKIIKCHVQNDVNVNKTDAAKSINILFESICCGDRLCGDGDGAVLCSHSARTSPTYCLV